jgi:methyl-CpG-binding domain protein 4
MAQQFRPMKWPQSPPPTPAFENNYERSPSPPYNDRPSIPTDDRGMIIKDVATGSSTVSAEVLAVKRRKAKGKRQPVQYVSNHFQEDSPVKTPIRRSREKGNASADEDQLSLRVTTPPGTPAVQPAPRIVHGLNIDELSSDSSLTDVPSDIGPDPFSPELVAVRTLANPRKGRQPKSSPYFPTPHKPRPHFLSTLPFPPILNATFGLMQERLCDRPFELLLATIFLNKTPGERAMPVCYQLLAQYPTPAALADAKVEDITHIIRHLGFQNQRAHKIVGLAKGWVTRPPKFDVRYRKVGYPLKGDGKNVAAEEGITDTDERVAWEISHLPGLGPYSHDSWRMFCRDKLRGRAAGYRGEDAGEDFEPEWKRVLPRDKELRAWMTWMWMKEGWVWDCETGKRTKAPEELMELARGGGVVVEEHKEGKEILRVEQGYDYDGDLAQDKKIVPAPQRLAGEILDEVKAEALD